MKINILNNSGRESDVRSSPGRESPDPSSLRSFMQRSSNFFLKIHEIFFLCFSMLNENMFTIELRFTYNSVKTL